MVRYTEFWQNIFHRVDEKIQPCLPGLEVNLNPFKFEDIVHTYYEALEYEYNILVIGLSDGRFTAITYNRSYTTDCWDSIDTKVGTSLEQIERFGISPFWRGYLGIVLKEI